MSASFPEAFLAMSAALGEPFAESLGALGDAARAEGKDLARVLRAAGGPAQATRVARVAELLASVARDVDQTRLA